MSARDEMLAQIRMALADRTATPGLVRDYRTAGSLTREQVVERFVERVRDYRATVVVTTEPAAAVAAALAEVGAQRVGVPADLDLAVEGAVADVGLTPRDLDALDGAVTACAVACADTGTIALDGGPGQGRRALTLVPDLHVCVVRADQVVETVPELVARLEPSAREGRPIVLVSGPSATSDIELNRVEGVHGPRRLVVVVAT